MQRAAVDPGVREREDFENKVRFFNNFLHSKHDHWKKIITNQLVNGQSRIPIELNDLEAAETGLSNEVLRTPKKFLIPWEDALLAFLKEIDEKLVLSLTQPLKLDISGSFGRNYVTPRGMTSETLHKMMCIEGIVIKASIARPKLVQSMHVKKYIDDGQVDSRDHRDQTSFVNSMTAGAMPTADADGNEMMIETGMSVYKDFQKFELQETPEETKSGQIPRRVEVLCDGDLTDKAKVGDRVQVIGVYQPLPPPMTDFTTGVFPARVIATNVTPIKEMIEAPWQTDDIRNIKELAAMDDAFLVLARSFAPAISGHDKVKAGLLLQMVGGNEKNLPNGTHLRGDLNVLLIGDPSCGKSQMLRFVMNVSPLAISTTGRGSSGVGLTAAVTRDPGSREFTLEAGAMVLADRGVICIDEFDKMSLNDRVAIHEAMEQQCVTIAKAGMHVELNARCSVCAAANPIYGSYNPDIDLAKNIGLPDSLLSRFDLVYVVRDQTTEEIDRRIATQVLKQAQLRLGNEMMRGVEQVHMSVMQRRKEADSRRPQEATQVWEERMGSKDSAEARIVTVDFLRKYLRYCRRLTPVLSQEAQAEVAERYSEMRMRFQSGFADLNNPDSSKKPRLAVTTRTLEALIRLSTAHAKLKLRKDEVLKEDVMWAYHLMLAAREEGTWPPGAAEEAEVLADDQDPPDAPDGVGMSQARASGTAPSGTKSRKRTRQAQQEEASGISSARLTTLQNLLARTFARQQPQQDMMTGAELLESINGQLIEGEPVFSQHEYDAGLQKLEEANKVMLLESGDVLMVG